MNKIDKELIENWVKDLVIIKTFIGLKFQEAILKSVSKYFKTTYRLSDPSEEAKGIDGYIGKSAVSIKPDTFESKQDLLADKIDSTIIFYEKLKDGIRISFSEKLV